MKLAGADVIIWLIIGIVVMVAKGLGKLATPGEDEPEEPAPRPRPRPVNTGLPARRAMARSVPPVVKPVTTDAWTIGSGDLREFMDRLSGVPKPQPAPPAPIAPPPVATPIVEKPAPTPVAPPAVAERRSPWVAALRDRSNIRNIIISAEIIGPPRGL